MADKITPPRMKRSAEWMAFRAKAQGFRSPEEKKAWAREKYREKRDKFLRSSKKIKPWDQGMVQDRVSGIWKVRVPCGTDKRRLTRYLTTGETERRQALKVVDASGVQKLSILARANCLTADAASIIIHGYKVTCNQIVKAWIKDLRLDQSRSTFINYKAQVKKLIRDLGCGDKPLSVITRDNLYNFINDISIKETTRKSRQAAIRSFYRHAAGFGHVVGNIATTIKLNQSLLTMEQRQSIPAIPFTDEEYHLVMSNPSVPQFWRWATALGYWLGLRMVDVCRLEWASIGEDFAVLYPQKTGRKLILPLHDPLIGSGALRVIFDEMRATIEPKETYCFPDRKKSYPGRFEDNVFNQYKAVMNLCGIEGKTFHGWRHLFRIRLSASGKPIEEVSGLMGHTSIKITEAYGRGMLLTG